MKVWLIGCDDGCVDWSILGIVATKEEAESAVKKVMACQKDPDRGVRAWMHLYEIGQLTEPWWAQ